MGDDPTGDPSEARALIDRARRDMRAYQLRLERDAGSAQVVLGGLGHVLVPAPVIARELPRVLGDLLDAEATEIVLYQLGFLTGRAHAEAYFTHGGIGEDELLYRVLTGPLHFAWAGYGDVDILLLDPVQEGEEFVALWETDNSFSAREGLAVGERRRTCHVQAGYSSGWLSAATRLPVETRELACRTEGARRCRFLTADARGLAQRLSERRFHLPRASYHVISARAPDAREDSGPDDRPTLRLV